MVISMQKLVFKKMPLEDNINFVKECFYNSDNTVSVHTYTVNLFPELASLDVNTHKEENDELIEDIVTKYYNSYNHFDDDIDRYTKAWNKYNDSFFEALTKYLNINWPKEHNVIDVTVGIIPVCPRYLDDFSFSLHDDISDDQLIETCAHELCHFLWFRKWKELYPKYPKNEYEAPSLVWEYSEMVVEPILNSDEISKVFDNKKTRYCYDIFYDIHDRDELFMDNLIKIYNSTSSIEEKIITGYEYFNKIKRVPK